MKKGDIVTIYQDPLTKKKPEGKAKLLEKLIDAKFKGDQEYWNVRFIADHFICARFI